jgi:hypothetical protein
VSPIPGLLRYASAFAAMLRGVAAVVLLVKRVDEEKFIASVLRRPNGSTNASRGSGISCMSDSWIALKPRIDEPSNIWPFVEEVLVHDAAGTLKCCMTPGRSQKRTSTNCTPSSRMIAQDLVCSGEHPSSGVAVVARDGRAVRLLARIPVVSTRLHGSWVRPPRRSRGVPKLVG